MRTRALLFAVGTLFAGSLAGCGGFSISSGDYVVVRIAAGQESQSGDANCQNDPNHTSTFDNGSTALFYGIADANGNDVYYLDTGSDVLLGKQNDDGSYAFTGKKVDVNDQGNTTITDTQTQTVSFTADGNTIKGTFVLVSDVACSGNCGGFPGGTCTVTVPFDGVVVQGADVPTPG